MLQWYPFEFQIILELKAQACYGKMNRTTQMLILQDNFIILYYMRALLVEDVVSKQDSGRPTYGPHKIDATFSVFDSLHLNERRIDV